MEVWRVHAPITFGTEIVTRTPWPGLNVPPEVLQVTAGELGPTDQVASITPVFAMSSVRLVSFPNSRSLAKASSGVNSGDDGMMRMGPSPFGSGGTDDGGVVSGGVVLGGTVLGGTVLGGTVLGGTVLGGGLVGGVLGGGLVGGTVPEGAALEPFPPVWLALGVVAASAVVGDVVVELGELVGATIVVDAIVGFGARVASALEVPGPVRLEPSARPPAKITSAARATRPRRSAG